MAERAINTNDGAMKVGVYSTPAETVEVVETEPNDSIRWGPIIGGLFAALATLITLSLLGLAIGFAAYDAGDPLGSFGIGAGVWGAISALIAFLIGGWVAGRSAAHHGRSRGVFNGAMVWFVAIPLLVYLLGSGLGALANTAGNVASTVAETAGAAVGAAAANPAVQATTGALTNDPVAQATAGTVVEDAQAAGQAALDSVTPQDVNNAADAVSETAWRTLLSLGLAAAASMIGGYLGGHRRTTTITQQR